MVSEPSLPDWVNAVMDTSKPERFLAIFLPIDPYPMIPILESLSDDVR